jgi:hypothetical protein
MTDGFFDPLSGGFFDTAGPAAGTEKALGVLGTRRKPFQDSPTPAGNSVAVIGLLRLYAYTQQAGYRQKAEETLAVLAGVAGKFGIFAASYGIAAVHLSHPHTQIVIVGEDDLAEQLHTIAVSFFGFHQAVLKLPANKAVPQNLPTALAETIPLLPAIKEGKSAAVVCEGFSCQPPVSDPDQFRANLTRKRSA